ncbi:MAG: hypothetical protein QOG55_3470, partial [Acidobacteriaceae bacterium]|nr:hypothetical protein [Acidobacteriaceae bacterium]
GQGSREIHVLPDSQVRLDGSRAVPGRRIRGKVDLIWLDLKADILRGANFILKCLAWFSAGKAFVPSDLLGDLDRPT